MSQSSNNKNTEHRQEYRLKDIATVFIELVGQSPDGEPEEILISQSVDISANGLKITAEQALPKDFIYQAAIQLPGKTERTQLTIQVRWSRINDMEDSHYIGLEVLNDSDSQLADWKKSISRRLINNYEEE